MSDLYQAVAARLAQTCPSAGDVRAATSAAEAAALPVGTVPTLLVVPAAERWTPVREAAFAVSQGGEIGFSVIVALSGLGVQDAWSQVRREIRAGLLGWLVMADEADGAVQARSARLLAYSPTDGGQWLHAFDFAVPAQASYTLQS